MKMTQQDEAQTAEGRCVWRIGLVGCDVLDDQYRRRQRLADLPQARVDGSAPLGDRVFGKKSLSGGRPSAMRRAGSPSTRSP